MKNIRLTTFEVVSTLSIIGLGPILLSYPQNAAKEFGSAAVLHYLYISALVLYNTIMADLNVEMVTIASLGYIVILGLFSKDVVYNIEPALAKWTQYIGYLIIFFSISNSLINEFDTMLYMGLLILMIIVTYKMKIGPIFLCSVLAELGMAFKVTREFWANIPWWIYLLTGGAILISFAVKNEASEKKDESKIKSKLKQMRQDLDM